MQVRSSVSSFARPDICCIGPFVYTLYMTTTCTCNMHVYARVQHPFSKCFFTVGFAQPFGHPPFGETGTFENWQLVFNVLVDLGILCITLSQSQCFFNVPNFVLSELPLHEFLLSASHVQIFLNLPLPLERDLAKWVTYWQGLYAVRWLKEIKAAAPYLKRKSEQEELWVKKKSSPSEAMVNKERLRRDQWEAVPGNKEQWGGRRQQDKT